MRLPLPERVAAIHDDDLPGHPRCLVRAEERGHVRDFLRRADAAERRARGRLADDLVVAREDLERIGVDEAARYRVHVDLSRGELEREVADERLDGRLGYANRGVARDVTVAAERGQREDFSPL